jgi:predicted PurR-regulated permease PerM
MSKHSTEQRNYLIFASFFIIISFLIMQSFLSGMLWGGITALSVWPILEKISSKKRFLIKEGVSKNALLFSILFFFLFFLPLAYAINEIANIYDIVKNYIHTNTVHDMLVPPHFIDLLPMKDKILVFWHDNIAHSANMINLFQHMTNGKIMAFFAVIWGELINRFVTLLVMLISFYFMLKNGQRVKNHYQDVFSYWLGDKSVTYIDNGIQALRGTINGVVLIGIIEGAFLAFPLVIGGVESGVLIGVLAGILGVIPMLMPALILPCLGYMYMIGEHTWAIVGLVDLLFVWFLFENIMKPQMISQKVKINTFIILISMIGGMQLCGPVGLFLGPAIVSMAIGMVQDFMVVPKIKQMYYNKMNIDKVNTKDNHDNKVNSILNDPYIKKDNEIISDKRTDPK